MFRSHLGSQPAHNVQSYSTNKTAAVFLQSARLFRALAPVRRMLIHEHVASGAPLARAMFWEFGACPEAWSRAEELKMQFMLGGDLLVAPVTEPSVQSGKVWLPPGTQWVHVWTQQQFDGDIGGLTTSVLAPFGQPPLFYRADTASGRATGQNLLARLADEGLIAPMEQSRPSV